MFRCIFTNTLKLNLELGCISRKSIKGIISDCIWCQIHYVRVVFELNKDLRELDRMRKRWIWKWCRLLYRGWFTLNGMTLLSRGQVCLFWLYFNLKKWFGVQKIKQVCVTLIIAKDLDISVVRLNSYIYEGISRKLSDIVHCDVK